MPNPVYPGAVWRPGVNAGYRAGRTPVSAVVCHYTVGRNSSGIGLQGYFQFLVARDGTVEQYAEADAVCWHGGSPWNGRGPGIEIEYLPGVDDDIFTPAAYDATARLCQWLHDEWLVPFDFYDGPRVTDHRGFITHRALIQTGDAHSDYWPTLPRVGDEPEQKDRMNPELWQDATGAVWVYDPNNHTKTHLRTSEALGAMQAIRTLAGLNPNWIRNGTTDALLADAREVFPAGGGGGAAVPLRVTLSGTATP